MLKTATTMINSVEMSKLRNGEFIQFLTDALETTLKKDPDNLQVRTQYDALRAVTNDTEKLFKISQGSPITEEIMALDARRDNAITGLTFIINGLGYSSDAAISRPAKTLAAHLAIFGSGIARDNYQSETASLRNILNDWNTKPELQQAITVLQLGGWQAELEAANNNFNITYMARTEEFGAASPDNLKAKRLAATAAYYKLRDTIDAHFTLTNGSEPYASLTQTINANINQCNALLAGRAGKATATASTAIPAA